MKKEKKQGELTETHILVKPHKKEHIEVWELIHNLPETPELSIMDAFESWTLRATTPTIDNFIDYVVSKDPTFICMKKSDLINNV